MCRSRRNLSKNNFKSDLFFFFLLCDVTNKRPTVAVLMSFCSSGTGTLTWLMLTLIQERESERVMHTQCFISSPLCMSHSHWTPLSLRAAPSSSSCQLSTIKTSLSAPPRVTHTHHQPPAHPSHFYTHSHSHALIQDVFYVPKFMY